MWYRPVNSETFLAVYLGKAHFERQFTYGGSDGVGRKRVGLMATAPIHPEHSKQADVRSRLRTMRRNLNHSADFDDYRGRRH